MAREAYEAVQLRNLARDINKYSCYQTTEKFRSVEEMMLQLESRKSAEYFGELGGEEEVRLRGREWEQECGSTGGIPLTPLNPLNPSFKRACG